MTGGETVLKTGNGDVLLVKAPQNGNLFSAWIFTYI